MSLLEVQQEFGRALAGVDAPPWIGAPDAQARLDVYRGTVRTVLVKALSLNFPAVRRLVGAEFFEWAAALFALDHLPAAANLDGYGEGFAHFLAVLPACAHLAYLPDVARVDWAVARAIHAEDAEPVDAEALAAIVGHAEAATLIAHPSVSFLSCRFPADAIWSAVLGDVPGALEAIDLDTGPCWFVIERRASRPQVSRMAHTEFEFARDLLGGCAFAEAIARAGGHAADVPAWLAQHLAAGRVAGWRIHPTEETS